MKNHEHYSGSEEINTLRDSEELIEFGKESLPKYTLEYWNDACKTMEPERINGLADALVAIKDGDSDEAVKMLKRDWLEDGLVLGSVATYLPEGVDVVRQVHMDVYGEDRSKENSAFLDQMEKWHDEQKKKLMSERGRYTEIGVLHDYYQREICDYLLDKIESKEFSHLMDPIIQKLDSDVVASINETFTDWGKTSSSEELVFFLADAMGIEAPDVERYMVPNDKIGHYPAGLLSEERNRNRIIFFVPEQKQDTYFDDDKTFLNSIRMVAHEMWHAYQNKVLGKTNRSELYKQKHSYTIEEINEDPEKRFVYIKSPREIEAFIFGDIFSTKFAKILRNQLEKTYKEEMNAIRKGGYKDDPEGYRYAVSSADRAKERLDATNYYLDRYTARIIEHTDICSNCYD